RVDRVATPLQDVGADPARQRMPADDHAVRRDHRFGATIERPAGRDQVGPTHDDRRRGGAPRARRRRRRGGSGGAAAGGEKDESETPGGCAHSLLCTLTEAPVNANLATTDSSWPTHRIAILGSPSSGIPTPSASTSPPA